MIPVLKTLKGKIRTSKEKLYFWTFRMVRKLNGSANSKLIKHNMHRLRGPLRISIDTSVSQLMGNEEVVVEQVSQMWGDMSMTQNVFHPINKEHTNSEWYQSQLPFIYALCEAFRRKDLTPVRLTSIFAEMNAAPQKHYELDHISQRLDFDVPYEEADPFEFIKVSQEIFPELQMETAVLSNNRINLQRYQSLLKHLKGKAHQKDVFHLIFCDISGLDVFLTTDQKFLNAFNQHKASKNPSNLRTTPMSPKDLCNLLKMQPITIPEPHSRAFRGTKGNR